MSRRCWRRGRSAGKPEGVKGGGKRRCRQESKGELRAGRIGYETEADDPKSCAQGRSHDQGQPSPTPKGDGRGEHNRDNADRPKDPEREEEGRCPQEEPNAAPEPE